MRLPYYFHDGYLEDVDVGPRREMTLTIFLNPIVDRYERHVALRFGSIVDFAAAEQWASSLSRPRPPRKTRTRYPYGRINSLYTVDGSKPGKLIIRIDVEYQPVLVLACAHATVAPVGTKADVS